MLKMRRRLERLENAMIPHEPSPPLRLLIQGVDSQRRVVSTRVLEVPAARPAHDHWRGDRRTT